MSTKVSNQALRTPRGQQLSAYIADTPRRQFPPAILEEAKRALVDFLGVAVGAAYDAPVRPVRNVVAAWKSSGNARIFLGERTTPALAALVNGTMAHAMDYDDVNSNHAGHPSGPCWSTALALAEHHGLGEKQAIAGFITGYEVMARLGGGGAPGVGGSLQRRGFHPTAVFGRAGAAAVACAMLGLNETQTAHALGIAATTAGGLVGSFGTDSKSFHAGKAAMDGILATQMASHGFVAATHLFELEKGLLDAFIQDKETQVPPLDFDLRWELLRNQYKHFASCRATHAATQAARMLAASVVGKKITKVRARVHTNSLVTAGKLNPHTPLEGKFSVPFCIAMGLRGYRVVASDFKDETMRDPSLREILPIVQLEGVPGQASHCARLEVVLDGGEQLSAETKIVYGHPDNPMSWDDFHAKFEGVAGPVLGTQKTAALYTLAREFEQPGSLKRISDLLADVSSDNK